jgi:hypothetical protein
MKEERKSTEREILGYHNGAAEYSSSVVRYFVLGGPGVQILA